VGPALGAAGRQRDALLARDGQAGERQAHHPRHAAYRGRRACGRPAHALPGPGRHWRQRRTALRHAAPVLLVAAAGRRRVHHAGAGLGRRREPGGHRRGAGADGGAASGARGLCALLGRGQRRVQRGRGRGRRALPKPPAGVGVQAAARGGASAACGALQHGRWRAPAPRQCHCGRLLLALVLADGGAGGGGGRRRRRRPYGGGAAGGQPRHGAYALGRVYPAHDGAAARVPGAHRGGARRHEARQRGAAVRVLADAAERSAGGHGVARGFRGATRTDVSLWLLRGH